ncbi:MAG: hypothetical protein ACFFCE_09735 [Promethearchaeota archaeon]
MSHVKRKTSRQYKEVLKKKQKRKRNLTIFIVLTFFVNVFVGVVIVLSSMS